MDRNLAAWCTVFLLLIFTLSFLWPPYAARMWATGHYQYFPLVFVAIALLLWQRRHEVDEARTAPSGMLIALSLLGLAILCAVANLLHSSFPGIIATVLTIWLAVYAAFGLGGLRAAAPVLALLIFAIPLPMRMDESLVVSMQLLASDLASRVLDGIGVIHFRQGVILQTENAQFMAEEACSGIRSLFSSWFVVAAYGVAARHRWWRVLINLLQTVLWVMLGNVLRIALVVSLADAAPWLASGWGHELLGLGVFAFILAMVASTDAGLSELISTELVIEPRDTSTAELSGLGETVSPPLAVPPFPLHGVMLAGVCAILLASAIISARAQWVRSQWAASMRAVAFINLSPPDEQALPETLAGFQRSSFRHIARGPNYLWAQDSYTWQYTDGALVAVVSVDSPWNHWHNLDHCYRNIGWQTNAKFSILPSEQELREAVPAYRHSELLMQRSGQHGFVVFSAIDRDGLPVAESQSMQAPQLLADPERFIAHARAVLGMGGQRGDLMTADRLPVSTVQLYAESLAPWTADDLQKLRELFFKARSEVVELRQQAPATLHP